MDLRRERVSGDRIVGLQSRHKQAIWSRDTHGDYLSDPTRPSVLQTGAGLGRLSYASWQLELSGEGEGRAERSRAARPQEVEPPRAEISVPDSQVS